jgi:hypothetical protein
MGGDAVQVMGAQHDGEPVLVERRQEVQNLVAGAHVDAGGGLVQDQDLRPAQQGPGDEHPLLLPARKLTDVAMAEIADAQALEDGSHLGLLLPAGPRQAPAPGAGHQDHFGHGHREVPVDRLDLGDVAGPQLGAADDSPRGGRHRTQEHPQERGLARAGRAHHPQPLPHPHLEVDVREHGALAVGVADAFEGHQRARGHCG